MDAKLRDAFLDAARKAAADTRSHGMTVEGEAKKVLQDKGVAINTVDKEAFRKRVAVQTENFIKQRPESKAFIEQIKSTGA
jgi:TRAP-type C4-dicarboxylate transport system substrate-binding protein